jgi:hypothetical protein
MKLQELEPQFVRYESHVETWNVVNGDEATWRERGCPTVSVTGPREYIANVDLLAQAQGVQFLCPKCFQQNSGSVGTHWYQVTFADRGVGDEHGSHGTDGKPTRWQVSGSGYHDLTVYPSIQLLGGCGWHGWIQNGEVT